MIHLADSAKGSAAARHRAARRPVTNLIPQVSAEASKRVAAVATLGTLVASTFAVTAAHAAATQPGVAHTAHAPEAKAVALGSLAEQARAALASAPVVTVAAGARISVESVSIEAETAVQVTPAPLPPPPPLAASRYANVARTGGSRTGLPVPEFALASEVIQIAQRYFGTPYVFGGSTPAGFDCSGFTQHVFAQVGISLPRTSSAQRNVGTVISAAEARPGDLMWWRGHVAIYAGNGMQIDASRAGVPVDIRPIHRANPTFIRL